MFATVAAVVLADRVMDPIARQIQIWIMCNKAGEIIDTFGDHKIAMHNKCTLYYICIWSAKISYFMI